MKILHVVPYFSGAWAYGGIPRVVSGLARSLADEGHEVWVLTTGVEGSQPARVESVEDGVRIHFLPNLSRRLAERYQLFLPLGVSRFLKNLPDAFDLVHIHGCHHLLGVLAGRHFLQVGIPYIISPHGTAPRIEQRIMAKFVFDQLFWNRVFSRADHYHAVSRYEENQLRDMGIPPGPWHSLPEPHARKHSLLHRGGHAAGPLCASSRLGRIVQLMQKLARARSIGFCSAALRLHPGLVFPRASAMRLSAFACVR